VVVDAAILDAPLLGEGTDQKAAWEELLREVAEASAGELLASTGQKCRVEGFEAAPPESQVSCAFQLRSSARAWTILVRDDVRPARSAAKPAVAAEAGGPARPAGPGSDAAIPDGAIQDAAIQGVSPGVELLLDVELEATLRFGCREMPLGELLDLGPGDVVQLDRNVTDPVDLIVGDKIVARGEVVLVNGNFGLRVTEVAAPRKRLESIRCLF
jgi:flagellar motor switch protein FliN